MKYGILDPTTRTARIVDVPDYPDALVLAGLEVVHVDIGFVAYWPNGDRLNIIVYEFGLLDQKYQRDLGGFVLNYSLYFGPAVIYQATSEGETIDIDENLINHLNDNCSALTWLDSPQDAEREIAAGRCNRPETRVNGQVVWTWTATEKERK